MNREEICSVQETKLLSPSTVQTTYKIKGGGYIIIKSIFNNKKDFKEAIFPAAVESLKQNLSA